MEIFFLYFVLKYIMNYVLIFCKITRIFFPNHTLFIFLTFTTLKRMYDCSHIIDIILHTITKLILNSPKTKWTCNIRDEIIKKVQLV